MIYTNDPVSDYETYMKKQERANKEWHEENDARMQEEIEELEFQIENLKIDLKNATTEDEKWAIECDIEELLNDIEVIREEMEEEY